MKKILLVFGTRPEGIKMAPLIHILKEDPFFDIKICVSGQHKEMLDQVLNLFNIEPDYDLAIMTKHQDLYDVTSRCLLGLREVMESYKPDIVLVHGDTTTTFATALAAYYKRIPVGHVEAGLRTNNIYSPWPEEINRQLTDRISTILFAPTQESKLKLLQEGIADEKVIVTGNTVVDALLHNIKRIESEELLEEQIHTQLSELAKRDTFLRDLGRKFILVTAHRRENFGKGIQNICDAINKVTETQKIPIIYPVHLNPNIKNIVHERLDSNPLVHLITPVDYMPFIYLMRRSYLILSDSGGIQEEAPSLGKPVLVLRDTTERPEGINAGTLKLVGTDTDAIYNNTVELLENRSLYQKMARAKNPYGDGNSSKKIAMALKRFFYG